LATGSHARASLPTPVLRKVLRNRSFRFAAGFAVAVVVPVAVLVYVQLGAVRDLERTSVLVLEALSRQTADAIAKAIEQDFEQPAFVIERLDHLAIEQFRLLTVSDGLIRATRLSRLADAYYLWSENAPGGRAAPVLELPGRGLPGDPAGVAARFVEAGAESARLHALAADLAAQRQPWGSVRYVVDGRPNVLVLHLLFESSARTRLTSFIGFRVDLRRLPDEYLAAAVNERLVGANRQTGLGRLMVTVADQDGELVFQSAAGASEPWVDERTIPLVFFDREIMPAHLPCESCLGTWRLRTSYGGRSIASLARAGTVGHRAMLVTLVLVLAVSLALVARAAVKEVQLSEAKSHFVASVSHDLKTPLALIQLFAETLELGRVRSAERAREYYRIIGAEARKLAGLIDNLLDFSKIDAGVRMYRLAPVDLGELARSVVARLGPQFEQGGFEVRFSPSPGLPPVLADAEAVELAVGNLLSNAMKYSGRAREIDVAVGRDASLAWVRVTDRGVGIPRRLQRRVFEKFFRIEREGDVGGCGLGLAIVDQVMRAHGGRVRVQSEPGQGSAFTLYFPIPKGRRDVDEARAGDRRRAPDAAGVA